MGTVSNVLNNPDRVSPSTRARVEAAIASLGYVRNAAARSLAAGYSSTIGFVVVDLSNSFFLDMVRGAEGAAGEAGFNVVLANADSQDAKQRTYLTLFEEERVAGVLLAPQSGSLRQVAEMRARGTRVVLLNAHVATLRHPDVCAAETDNVRGGYLAARHLIELGRRRLLFAGADRFPVVADRLAGARAAVSESPDVRLEVIITHGVRVEDGREVGDELDGRPADRCPDGIVAGADLLALGVIQSILMRSRFRIPEDIAVVGYDNNQAAWSSVIPISTVDQVGEDLGRAAAQLLIEEVRSPLDHGHRKIVLEPVLVPKASTLGP